MKRTSSAGQALDSDFPFQDQDTGYLRGKSMVSGLFSNVLTMYEPTQALANILYNCIHVALSPHNIMSLTYGHSHDYRGVR